MVDTKAVSVRLPLDLLSDLNSYATDNGMVRNGDANIGGAIIAILKEHFEKSDSVKQSSNSVDIEAMVNMAIADNIDGIVSSAVEARLASVLSEVSLLRSQVSSVETFRNLYENLRTNLTVVQGVIKLSNPDHSDGDETDEHLPIIEAIATSTSEATAPAKKPLLSVMREKVLAA